MLYPRWVTRWSLVLLLFALPAAAAPAIHVTYDVEHLDLDKHVLSFKPSRGVTEASLVVIGEDGGELGKGTATYEPTASGWLAISWTQPANARVMVMKLRVAAADGTATNVQLIPWSVTVDHEDVTFATDSAAIAADQRAKVDASLAKITDVEKRAAKYMKLTLYIAGHTDTVGPAAKNQKLSEARALAIGKYLRDKGLAMPIVVGGFGESVPKVATPDETDEPANRRADYVLGPAGGAPPFKAAAKASWKPLR